MDIGEEVEGEAVEGEIVADAAVSGENSPAETASAKDSSTRRAVSETSDGTESEELEMNIKNPIIFASYTFDGEDRSYYTLLFECIKGTYDSSQAMWGREWSGTFRFRLIEAEPGVNMDSYEEGVISCYLQQAFSGPFELYVKDYNGDGLMEFALTQMESFSGGDTGRIFTLQKDGTVTEIPIKNDRRCVSAFGLIGLQEEETGVFLIPFRHTGGSAELDPVENGFLIRTEDPFRGGSDSGIYFLGEEKEDMQGAAALEDIYLWDGSAFVLTEQRLIYE